MKRRMKTTIIAAVAATVTMSCATPGDALAPCRDTATILTVGTDAAASCHPQASLEAAPVGSAAAVLVSCRCAVLPQPCGCDCGASCSLPTHDSGTE